MQKSGKAQRTRNVKYKRIAEALNQEIGILMYDRYILKSLDPGTC